MYGGCSHLKEWFANCVCRNSLGTYEWFLQILVFAEKILWKTVWPSLPVFSHKVLTIELCVFQGMLSFCMGHWWDPHLCPALAVMAFRKYLTVQCNAELPLKTNIRDKGFQGDGSFENHCCKKRECCVTLTQKEDEYFSQFTVFFKPLPFASHLW